MDAAEGKLKAEGEFIHNLVERIRPTVEAANSQGKFGIDDITELHVQDTINELLTRSQVISDAVKAGKLAVVGANYKLALGEIHPIVVVGDV
jgi:carbonic anhydrase